MIAATATRTRLGGDEVTLLRTVLESAEHALHVALWNPYEADVLPEPALVSYGFQQPSLRAVADVLRA